MILTVLSILLLIRSLFMIVYILSYTKLYYPTLNPTQTIFILLLLLYYNISY